VSPTPGLESWVEELWGLPLSARRDRIRDRWPSLHGPLHVISPSELIRLFRSVGYVSDGPERPSAAISVFRGALAVDDARGISWSTSEEHAGTYASGYTTVGETCLWRATCPPEAVLARFGFEEEIVVDPELLVDVAVVRQLPRFELPAIKFTLPGGITIGGR
jgi:hypothetical protein